MTGVGYPQLSAIIECADAAHGLRGQVCADGGCRTPGDVCKAFAGGADFVMLGGMLAGHDECDGEWIEANGRRTGMLFYGMSSKTAIDKHAGGLKNYRASEGREVIVPYKGPVRDTIQDIYWFCIKVAVFMYLYIWYRGTFPRYRFDQLMKLGWKVMIPMGLGVLVLVSLFPALNIVW